MKAFRKYICAGAIAATAGGAALAGETSVVYRIDGRSGYHIQRKVTEKPTTMAVYPQGRNVKVITTVADQTIGSYSGSRGRSGYSYPFRADQ